MGKFLNGAVAAAALLWAGTAQAAFIKYEFIATGFGERWDDTYSDPNPSGIFGAARAVMTIVVDTDNPTFEDGPVLQSAAFAHNALSATHEMRGLTGSFSTASAIFADNSFGDDFPLFAQPLTPLSGRLEYSTGPRGERIGFQGDIVSVRSQLLTSHQGPGYAYTDVMIWVSRNLQPGRCS